MSHNGRETEIKLAVEVYLCWRVGEPNIAFWHGVDEGFAGRKPIDHDFLEHHTGESTE